jgi:hypothetical protein
MKARWKRAQVQFGRPIQEDIDALVGDGGRVNGDKRLESFESRLTGAVVADARKPAVLIEFIL